MLRCVQPPPDVNAVVLLVLTYLHLYTYTYMSLEQSVNGNELSVT